MVPIRRAIATTLLSAAVVACNSTASPSATTPPAQAPTRVQPAATPAAAPASPSAAPTLAPTPAPSVASNPVTAKGALTGAIPVALRGTWQYNDDASGHWVFGADRASSYNDTPADGFTLLGAGTSGDELSLGPRLDDPTLCQKIGLYHWKLVTPTELRLTPVRQDPCPRGQALLHAAFHHVSDSMDPLGAATTAMPPACPLVTSAEIAGIRGIGAELADPGESSPSVSDCIWTVSDTNARVVLDVTVQRFNPSLWANATATARRQTRGRGWVGVNPAGSEGLLSLRANGYVVDLALPGLTGTSTPKLEREEAAIADLVVGRLAPAG